MSLSGTELEALASEFSALIGSRVQKITVASNHLIALELRLPGETVVVSLDVSPRQAHVCIIARRPTAPERSLGLQGLLRAHLIGGRLDAVTADAERRMVSFSFVTGRGSRRLLFEISGNAGAIILLDEDDKVLGGVFDSAKDRRLGPGRRWTPPLKTKPGHIRFALEPNARWPLSAAVSRHYATASAARDSNERLRRLMALVRRELFRTRRTLEKIRADRSRIAQADVYRQRGDLLKPVLKSLARGATEAVVTEWRDDGPARVRVPLQPHLSPRENMERYYHQHRRLSRSASLVEARFRLFEQEEKRLAELLERIGKASDEELEAIESETAQPVHRPASRRATTATRVPYRQYLSLTGQRIWVGRGARDNDALTFRHARGNDLWLHARGVPGSHVIIPGCGPAGPDQETLLDAATLAAHFSGARGELLVDVATTPRKYVQKPKGAAPGAVRFSQERAVSLRFEKHRLERVLASEEPVKPG